MYCQMVNNLVVFNQSHTLYIYMYNVKGEMK